jgi:predicted dehydrogenase
MNAAAHSMTAARTRLGFVGLGWIGHQRLDALAHDATVDVVACVDTDAALAERVASGFTRAEAFDDLQDCLALDLDGLVIATPTGLHESQTLAALDRGLAVFCQKPLAADAAGVGRIITRAATVNRLLGVDFCYRCVAGMRHLREQLRARAYGEILAIDLTFHNAYAPSSNWAREPRLAGGGCLLDLGIHLLDLLVWLQDFPTLIVEQARLFSQGRGIEELAVAQLRQKDGACVRLACSWNAHLGQGAEIEVSFRGTRGGARWHNLRGSFHEFEMTEHTGDHREVVASGPDDWHARALRHWAAELAGSKEFNVDALGYAASAELVEAIYARGRRS